MLAGTRLLGIMPTGAGKSLCFQLPALILDGVTVVVSPLISLMRDQVDQLLSREIPATLINSSVPAAERAERLRAACAGRYRLLYVAPERFSPAFFEQASGLKTSLFVVDEAHCISQWGHDFRPHYGRLGEAARALGADRLAAFTATATPMVRDDILRQLGIESRDTFVFGFHRPNLRLDVVPVARPGRKTPLVERYLRANPEAPGIVYAATRKTVDRVWAELEHGGIEVGRYHAGMGLGERSRAQERFMTGEHRVMVATNAFGMGVDRQDLRFVIHYEMPGSIESYYQEAGRAGRDGEPAVCTLLYSPADTRIHRFFMETRQWPSSTSEAVRARVRALDEEKLKAVVRYGGVHRCRHAELLAWFGEPLQAPCHACDVCLGGPAMMTSSAWAPRACGGVGGKTIEPRVLSHDESVVVQKVLSAVARARGMASATAVVQALVGATTPEVVASPLVGSRTHGILKGWKRPLLLQLLRQLGEVECVVEIQAHRGRFELTDFGREVMWGRRAVELKMPAFGPPATARPSEGEIPLDARQAETLERLGAVRTELARTLGVPPYVICNDATLRRIVRTHPSTRAAMMRIRGVGPTTEARYGERFRRVLEESA